jgi:2-desacetyl-2-hydroxyethyl bacteriochlorophyllide A dehydrogenase
MKAQQLVFPSKMKVEIESIDIPDDLADDQILIENHLGLISPGTELAMFTETHIGFPIPDFKYAKYPFRPGYAAVGKVLRAGKKIKEVKEGDFVYHGGTHASHSVQSLTQKFYPVRSASISDIAAFTSLAFISLTSVRLSDIRLGQNVAVFGLGMVGNLAGQLMKIAGARNVIGFDTIPERLQIAKTCGFTHALNPKDIDLPKTVKEITGEGCHIVVEATGNPTVLKSALSIASSMGKVILLGSPRGKAEIDLYFDIHRTGVNVIGAHGKWQDAARVYGDPDPKELMLEFISTGRLNVKPLLTHTMAASQAESAYQGLLKDSQKYMGVMLDLKTWN